MLHSLFLAAALTLALGAPTAEDLQVVLTPASTSVKSIDDIFITATVSNPTSQDIRVLAVNNILDKTATRSFGVKRDDKEVGFHGIKAIYDLSAEDLYKVIPAGSSVTVNHTNLAALYNFESLGAGKFQFLPEPLYAVGANKPVAFNARDITIDVTSDVLRRNPAVPAAYKSKPTCDSSPEKLQFITRALADATGLARDAAAALKNNSVAPDFQKYFKSNSAQEIEGRFTKIADDAGNRVISCIDKYNECKAGVVAYTTTTYGSAGIVTSDIFSCEPFFTITKPTPSICQTGYDSTVASDGGVLLHELSHATSGTGDLGYGCRTTEQLSAADQLDNADNYRCMSLAVYYRTKCPPK